MKSWFTPSVPSELDIDSVSLGDLLQHECVMDERYGQPVVLMRDGAVGTVWEIECLPHEVMSDEQLTQLTRDLAQSIGAVEGGVVQLVYESLPAYDLGHRELADHFAGELVRGRCRMFEAWARDVASPTRPMQRRLWMTLRMPGPELPSDQSSWWRRWVAPQSIEDGERQYEQALDAAVMHLQDVGGRLQGGVSAYFGIRLATGQEVLDLLRRGWNHPQRLAEHPLAEAAGGLRAVGDVPVEQGLPEVVPHVSLSKQVLQASARISKGIGAIGVEGPSEGRDGVWEVLSLMNQPAVVRFALFSALLQIQRPLRCVVSLRQVEAEAELARTSSRLKYAMDARSEAMKEDVNGVLEGLANEDQLVGLSVHLGVLTEGLPFEDVVRGRKGAAPQIRDFLAKATGAPWQVEDAAGVAIWLAQSPLSYRSELAHFLDRERRVLSRSVVGAYLPVFRGYEGTGAFGRPPRHTHLMHSRGGEPVWNSSWDASTNQHIAVLAESGSGKSYLIASYVAHELATNPDSFAFVLDVHTSFEVLAEAVCAREEPPVIAKPPASMPNIWAGGHDDERVSELVSILCVAMELEEEGLRLNSRHKQLLGAGIRKVYEDKYLEAGTHFVDGALEGRHVERLMTPRLSEVMDVLAEVATLVRAPASTAVFLREKLLSYYGDGRYSHLFDVSAEVAADPPTPRFTIFDLAGVAGDPVLEPLVSVICVSEVTRHLRRPENRGRPAVFVVDEAHRFGGAPILAEFVETAWRVFRRLDVVCIAATNAASDYIELPGCAAMWKQSATKILLPIGTSEIRALEAADMLAAPIVGELVGTLARAKGQRFSEFVWEQDGRVGTCRYYATGLEAWAASSRPKHVELIREIAGLAGGWDRALEWLADRFPTGPVGGELELARRVFQEAEVAK